VRFLECDAMLYQVGSGLAPIPGKLDIAHSIILAIPGPSKAIPRSSR
jgi:hypothetical protein